MNSRLKRIWALATLVLLCLTLASPTFGLLKLSPVHGQDQDLADQATHIIVGRVENITSFWENGTIVTNVAVRVKEPIKGGLSADSRITVKHFGGEVGNIGLLGDDQPIFVNGERTKLFLKLGKDGVFTVVGGKKGKISLDQPALSGAPTYAVNSPPMRWSYSDLPVHYRINPTPPAGVTQTDWLNAVTWSFKTGRMVRNGTGPSVAMPQ